MTEVDTMKVQITGGVTGRPHYLAYSAGQIVVIPKDKATELIDNGLAAAYTREEPKKAKKGAVKKATNPKVDKAEKR